MELLQRLLTRFRAWRLGRQVSAAIPLVMPASLPLFREVSPAGVRIFSLCGSCGARLEMSATLCNACAQRRSPSSF